MYILAIETSCDETASAVVKANKDHLQILSNIISSQIKLHQKFGGVVPEKASRTHLEKVIPIIKEGLKRAKVTWKDIDLIAVTIGPGLIGSLLVGVETAKALAYALDKPIIGVSHITGHIFSCFAGANPKFEIRNSKLEIRNLPEFPILILTVSGGHTNLVLMKSFTNYKIIGQTLDDAAGECFDKVAKLLGLGYPGGPAIEKAAQEAKVKNQNAKIKMTVQNLKLPRSMVDSKDFNFSFSGLKTAVLYLTKKLGPAPKKYRNYIASELQQTIVDILVTKTINAARKLGVNSIGLAGGVSANKLLRTTMRKECQKAYRNLYLAPMELATDNAAMIGIAATYKPKKERKNWDQIYADANLEL